MRWRRKRGGAALDIYDLLCHYNQTALDRKLDLEQDCGQAALWHIHAVVDGHSEMYQACDAHLGRGLAMPGVSAYHQFGSACGLEGSLWLLSDNHCVTEDIALRNGLAWITAKIQEDLEATSPDDGVYGYVEETGHWFRRHAGRWEMTNPPVHAMGWPDEER